MTKLTHIMVSAVYKDGMGYQENILPMKHKALGYDVDIITFDQGGEASHVCDEKPPYTYMSEYDIPVHVLAKREATWMDRIPHLRALPQLLYPKTVGLYETLEQIAPDIVFVHGIDCNDHKEVLKYIDLHPVVRFYADNHNDYYNRPLGGWKRKVIRTLFPCKIGQRMALKARKMWGVTPWRVQYLHDVFGVPKEKIDLLVMGGDERYVDLANRDVIRKRIRNMYGIADDTFLVVTGGKIDKAKNTHLLIEAIDRLSTTNDVHLLIFGRVEPNMQGLLPTDNKHLTMAGWIPAIDAYDIFQAADLAVFPGTHSVLWEQACASGVPAIFKDWDGGFCHVDVGGNCELVKDITADKLYHSMAQLIHDREAYLTMLHVAQEKATQKFSYMEIAKRAVEYDQFEGKTTL